MSGRKLPLPKGKWQREPRNRKTKRGERRKIREKRERKKKRKLIKEKRRGKKEVEIAP